MRTDGDIEFPITVQVTECHITWRICDGCVAEGCAKLAVTFAFQDRNRTSGPKGHDKIELPIVIHIADQDVAWPTLYGHRRTGGVGEQRLLRCV
jgi:hypothetical protein